MLDYMMAREVFVDMGEQMHRHVFEINSAWGTMLDYYSDLNNARKEHDEQYVVKEGFGEDTHEPVDEELGKFRTTLYDHHDLKLTYQGSQEGEVFRRERARSDLWSEEGSEQDTREILKELKTELLGGETTS